MIELMQPGSLKLQTSEFADFIADDHYLSTPDHRVVIVNPRTYAKIKAMTHAEFQFFIGELIDFTQVQKEMLG